MFSRFRSGTQDRLRLNQIAGLARGPKFAPRALMALSEIAIKDNKEDEAVDALERLLTCIQIIIFVKRLIFNWLRFFENRVAGPEYDQGATLKALNFYEDYLILFDELPPRVSTKVLRTTKFV